MPFYIVYQTENTQEIMGKILVGGGGGGDQERSPTGGETRSGSTVGSQPGPKS